MLRSMYSGISGMKANQTKMDVIGNNIANVGTTAFKSSTAKFQDMLSQNVREATAPTMNQGGLNANQVGLGVQLSSIDTVMKQGMLQPTGRNLDLAIDGEGFFMVSRGPEILDDDSLQVSHRAGSHNIVDQSLASSGAEIMYSRDGSFILDESGNLLTSDGYRVLGYPLTNDDNSQPPTGKKPGAVDNSGFNFRFGPGSQLNDYKIVLGEIGPGTKTSADVDLNKHIIKLNGDFSENSGLKDIEVESALNKALSSAGISQRINVSGNAVKLKGLGTETVNGGSDATAPASVSIMGVTFQFDKGSALNGYSIKIGDVSSRTVKAEVNDQTHEIIVNGNFLENGFVNANDLAEAINKAVTNKGIKQEVKATGMLSTLSQLKSVTDESGKDAKKPGDKDGKLTVGGVEFELDLVSGATKGAQLNGYSISIKNDSSITANPPVIVKLNKDNKSIEIVTRLEGDKADTSKVAITQEQLKDAINDEFKSKGMDDVEVKSAKINTATSGTETITGGENLVSPKVCTINGLNITLPKGSVFNNVEIVVEDIDGKGLKDKDGKTYEPLELVHIETKPDKDKKNIPTKIRISADFRTLTVDGDELAKKINEAIAGASLKDFPSDATKFTDDQKVSISGTAKILTGLESSNIDGGTELKAPNGNGNFTALGMNFTFGKGAALNDYKIVIGDISAGTKPSAKIDDRDKVITINGDFVNPGVTTAKAVNNAIYAALQDKGIEQTITVSAEPVLLTNTESLRTYGGTPVESLGEDGELSFVDGTKPVRAYDGSLKTLRIPDKIKVPGTDEYLKVKSYTIDKTGIVNCILEDGSVAAVGQLAMASFKNPEGLTKNGGNLYSKSSNSGEPTIKSGVGTTEDDNSKGYGSTLQGMLEMSNVDLAQQFTDMIVTNRSFQASGKMISTGDEILQDIINLKR